MTIQQIIKELENERADYENRYKNEGNLLTYSRYFGYCMGLDAALSWLKYLKNKEGD